MNGSLALVILVGNTISAHQGRQSFGSNKKGPHWAGVQALIQQVAF